ncbi:metallophosphoesterase [Niabella defluvii]|nr:metallophosphoesterase [Niabella sp. I65]
MKTFVMGDLHGAYKALDQCLLRCGFDPVNDTLIQLGDVCDGHSEVYECVEVLINISNLVAIKGNHDVWFQEFLETDFHPVYWIYGGVGTIRSYLNHAGKPGMFRSSGSGYKTALESSNIPQAIKIFLQPKDYIISMIKVAVLFMEDSKMSLLLINSANRISIGTEIFGKRQLRKAYLSLMTVEMKDISQYRNLKKSTWAIHQP